jgi:Cof subfamily protein (haloacid dehalogenase superfamily)
MGKFDGILLGSDLDGTLLRHDKSLSEENKKAIEYFKSEGGIFTFFTGRLPVGTLPVLEMIMPNAPYGCMNGAGIADAESGKYLWSMTLRDEFREILEYVEREHPYAGIEFSTDKIYFYKKNDVVHKHIRDEKLPDLICDYRTFSEPVCKVLFGVHEDMMNGFVKAVCAHPKAYFFDFVRSDKIYFELVPKGASKGNVLLKIADMVGVDRSRTIAVGDNDNDISMLEAAGIGIAVSNASENAVNAADFVTVSNEEHAIAKIIENIEKGVYKF